MLRSLVGSRTPILLAVAILLSTSAGSVRAAFGQEAPAKPESISDRKVEDLMKDLASGNDVRREVAEVELPRRGREAIPPLLACLEGADRSAIARVSAARILAKVLVPKQGDVNPEAAAEILSVFKDQTAPPEVRGEAARTLGELKVKSALNDLVEALNDNWFKVSESSRDAIVRMGQSAMDAVIDAYHREINAREGKDGIIYRSILICGDVGGDKARGLLSEAIKTKFGIRQVAIRAHAARALGMTGDRLCIQPLIDAYETERDFDVAQAMVRSLEWLTGQQDILPQPLRWKAWWEAHKDEVLGNADHRYDNLLIPKGGIKKGDPLQAPGLKGGDEPTPKADAPKADAPKTDAPKTDAPKTDAPKTDAPGNK